MNLLIERYHWFDAEVRKGRYPNAATLARHFEISNRTAQRNIAFMAERIGAPLAYDAIEKGYFYEDEHFSLPPPHVTQEELVAILIARRLLAGSSGGLISRDIASFSRKLFSTMGDLGLPVSRLEGAFSAVWPAFSPAPEGVFRSVIDAMLADRLLRIRYVSPTGGSAKDRTVEPHHLQHYAGSWVLIAFCRLKKQWRKFYLSRMAEVSLDGGRFVSRPVREWSHLLEGAFGIFQGPDTVPVTLRFNGFRSKWIREQVWHVDQVFRDLPDGGLELTFPVADFREVRMKILQFGADVEVVEPEALRLDIQTEVRKMTGVYQSRPTK